MDFLTAIISCVIFREPVPYGGLMGVTIKDIAKACGVSKTTVSRYLNQSGYVSEEVTNKIKMKVEELNYIPSQTARNLSNQSSNVIGVVIPEVSNPFFAEIFKGISSIADSNNFNLLYCDTDNDPVKELKNLSMLRTYNVAGLIITPASSNSAVESYEKDFSEAVERLNVPVVLMDRDLDTIQYDGVFTDNFKGAYDCTKLLLEGGHRRVATIKGDTNFSIGRERYRGYCEALSDAGLEMDERFVYDGDFTSNTAYRLTKEIMKSSDRPSGIFSPNNLTTIGILKALYEDGYKIPDDISVVSFDDIELLTALNIRLSVVKRDPEDMGRKAMELLLDKMNSYPSDSIRKVVIEPAVIDRSK